MPSLPWIRRAPGAPYFVTDAGEPWTPIGHNDAIAWPELNPLFRRRDPDAVRRNLRFLRDHGVSCIRLMLEYAHREHRYIERPVGTFVPNMVRFWDDLFGLCEEAGMRILLTPFDTYFVWTRFRFHPYNRANGGPCPARTHMLIDPDTRLAIKNRLRFAAERWGGSGALFAWDLYNEMHPAQGNNVHDCFDDYISDVAPFLRDAEVRAHGRAHPQCVSVFGPELGWKPWLNEPIFRHPMLDFASSHFYEEGTIDDPRDTVAPAVAAGRLTREALAEITDQRPFFDSEHGPIHTFKDRHVKLPPSFDDEYFRHIQWAHLASGGAGGGMRWPNRHPHVLTPGMREAQRGLAGFLPLVDWPAFDRRNLNDEIDVSDPAVARFGCGDARQAVVYLLRTGPLRPDGRLDPGNGGPVSIRVPGLAPGVYRAATWHTADGRPGAELAGRANGAGLALDIPALGPDLALAVRPAE